jgi:hypothetical protein
MNTNEKILDAWDMVYSLYNLLVELFNTNPMKLLPFNQTIKNKCILISSKNKLGIIFVIFILLVMCIEYLFNARVLMMTNTVKFTGKEFYDLVRNNSQRNSRERNNKVVNIFKNDTVLLSKVIQNSINSTKKKNLKKKMCTKILKI